MVGAQVLINGNASIFSSAVENPANLAAIAFGLGRSSRRCRWSGSSTADRLAGTHPAQPKENQCLDDS
jgi:hypothetical protein